MPRASIFEHASHEEACDSDTRAQNPNHLNFSPPPISLPHAQEHTASLSHKYLEPLAFGEADLRFALSPRLAAL